MSIWALVCASAIPVVMFALWAEYFKEDLNQADPSLSIDREAETESAIARLRLAGLLSTTLQLVIFLSTSPIRREVPGAAVAGMWITLAALVAQRLQQASIENEILSKHSQSDPGRPGLTLASSVSNGPGGTQLLWAFAGVVIYLGLLAGSLMTTAVAIAYFKWSGWKAILALGTGTLAGYTLSLASNFVISPWLIKRVIPGRPLQDSALRDRILNWFDRSGVQVPELRIMDASAARGTANAWVTGLAWMRGPFQPVLWLTPALLKNLSEAELEAVVKHEVVHMRRNHLTQRFLLAWAMSLLVLVTLSGALGLAAILPSERSGPILPVFSLFLGVAIVWGSFKALRDQSHRHELEADWLCIQNYGVSPSVLASAIQRVDQINRSQSGGAQLPITGTHPALEARLAALKNLRERDEDSRLAS
ncbi:MAG: M48 family metalloprotease [Oligoflexia bacterium]|jgi:Zn-dependent protease with chaperone function